MSPRVSLVVIALVLAGLFFYWQPANDVHSDGPLTIGVLHPSKVDLTTFGGFKAKMVELGYEEGKDVVYMYDGPTGKGEGLHKAAQGMAEAGVDLIFASSTPATIAAKKATQGTNIPVVFGPVNDPVAAGIVESYTQPGGNVTGVRLPASGAKRLQWMQTIAPQVKTVLLPITQGAKSSLASLKQAREGAQGTGITIIPHEVSTAEDVTQLLANLPEGTDAIFLPRDAFINAQIHQFSKAAIEKHLPLTTPGLIQVEAGGLYSYGFEHSEVGRHAAELAHKILSGSSPNLVPVETARSYLFINLATANAIGTQISTDVLKQAKQIIR